MHFDDQDPALAATANMLRADILRFKSRAANDKRGPLKLIVADFEFVYDMVSFRAYQAAENDATNGWVRWPFCHVVAAAWTTLTFPSESTVPAIGPIVTLTCDTHCERTIAEAFFTVAEQLPEAVLTSWGGEQKDWPVLRRVAAELGMPMPLQLTDMRIHAPSRLDLCNATSTQARCAHLPEYAAATGIPAKPIASKAVGAAAVGNDWPLLAEQVRADLFTTSIIAARHAISHRMALADVVASEQAIAVAFADAHPKSAFLRKAGQEIARARAMPLSAKVA